MPRALAKDLSLAGAGLMLGVVLGAIGADLAASRLSLGFWVFVAVCSIVVIGLAWNYIRLDSAERRFHASKALEILFEGVGTDCLWEFEAKRQFDMPSYVMAATTYPPAPTVPVRYSVGVTLARLRVRSIRERPLDKVRVWLREVHYASDGQLAHEFPERLRWMHDNGDAHYESLQGRRLTPKDLAYIDLAQKWHPDKTFLLQLADPHLSTYPIDARDIRVLVEAEGVDAATGQEAPSCRAAFTITIREDGGLSVLVN